MGGGRIIILHLDPDPASFSTTRFNDARQMLHRAALRRMHVMVGIGFEPSVIHEDGTLGTVDVLLVAVTNWVFVERQNHALMDIKRPTGIAGQPRHIRRIGGDQKVDAALFQGAVGLGDTRCVLGPAEW